MYALLAFLLLVPGKATQEGCSSELDCSLLGECVSSACVCDPGWSGPDCSRIREGVTDQVWPQRGDRASASWGASVLVDDGQHYMFTDVVCLVDTCAHTIGASIVQSVSRNGIRGPYDFVQVAIPAEIENVHASVAPDGTRLLFYGDHQYTFPNQTCTGSNTTQTARAHGNPNMGCGGPYPRKVTRMGIAFSGPNATTWQYHFPTYDESLNGFLPLVNPSPFFLPNGTLLLAFRFNGGPGGESNALAASDDWRGPYRLISAAATPGEKGEDPFLWKNQRGYHMLFHCYRGDRERVSGCHSYSKDGKSWTISEQASYNTTVLWRDRESGVVSMRTFDYRERPELVFEAGTTTPKWLLTGVEVGDKGGGRPCMSVSAVTEIL